MESFFHCSRPKDAQIMNIYLRHVKAIVCSWSFLVNFSFVCSKEGWVKEVFNSLFMVSVTVKFLAPYLNSLVSYNCICKCTCGSVFRQKVNIFRSTICDRICKMWCFEFLFINIYNLLYLLAKFSRNVFGGYPDFSF